MGENTKIEWADHTWNPWIGCAKVSPACDHCYAEDMMANRYGRVRWGAGENRARTSASNWREPRRWDCQAREAGRIATVFTLSLGDIWDNEVEPLWRRAAFEMMEQTPNLLYLLLSKRIGNAERMCDPLRGNPLLPSNAALGATMVNQEEWDRDMPKLRQAGRVLGARFTFASIEPMLGPIDMRGDLPDWVIVGGESGSQARPMHPAWARAIRDQCAAAGVPFLFKQWGGWVPHRPVAGSDLGSDVRSGKVRIVCADRENDGHFCRGDTWMARASKTRAGRLLDGLEHNGMLEVRA